MHDRRLPKTAGALTAVTVSARNPAVVFDKRGVVAEVVLNRPESRNAYDTAMRDGLYEAFTAIRDDPEVRVVLLLGNGPAFSTGGDLREFGTAPSPVAARAIRWRRDVWGTLWDLPQLTIAGVHGTVVGGGFEMMLLCDLCIAARDARFWLPETGLGMVPGVAGTQTLPRLVGRPAALELVLRGREIGARRARDMGLVQHISPPRDLRRRAGALADRLGRIRGDLGTALKRLVQRSSDGALADGLRAEARAAVRCQ